MDLDDFDIPIINGQEARKAPPSSAYEVLEEIDQAWYSSASRQARWMDLLGDYAGSEPFVIDGEALIQIVLDDPLLAIGKGDQASFQILHAKYILEKLLFEFRRRSAAADIVFWLGSNTHHATLDTGASRFITSSRCLARLLLFKHLLQLPIATHVFNDLDDPDWLLYESTRKPMFVMTNDGGVWPAEARKRVFSHAIHQRLFMFDLLSRGIPVALLKGAEYRDSKVLSFVYEQYRTPSAHSLFSPVLPTIVKQDSMQLSEKLKYQDISVQLSARTRLCKASEQETYVNILRKIDEEHPDTDLPLLYILVVHWCTLTRKSIQERARRSDKLSKPLKSTIVDQFFPDLFIVIVKILNSTLSTTVDFDGNVFCSILHFLVGNPANLQGGAIATLIGSEIYAEVHSIWSAGGLPSVDWRKFARANTTRKLSVSSISFSEESNLDIGPLLPFENQVLDSALSLDLPVLESDKSDSESSPRKRHFSGETKFHDSRHWHNQKSILPRHQGGAPTRPTDERARRRALRSDQRFMRSMQAQAATLTGALGGRLQQIIIPPAGSSSARISAPRPSSSTSSPASNAQAKPNKKAKQVKLSSADKLRQKIQTEKSAAQDEVSFAWWKEQLEVIAKMQTLDQKVSRMNFLDRNKRRDERVLGAEMRLYKINLEILCWIGEAERNSAAVRDRYTVSLFRMIKDLCDGKFAISLAIHKNLTTLLFCLGFEKLTADLVPAVSDNGRPLSFKFVKLASSRTREPLYEFMRNDEDPVTWQLRLFGEYMDRSMDSAPDPRVAFDPDAWQREVLDGIDNNDSLLVVAPTSAGKTFISFYAMEKVLRNSDDGILVYVAPTKALVSQIAAEVYARFSKNLSGAGSCWAIHTRDYRIHDPLKCQILVTVPEMLAIMLLSPPLARVWTPRIKRIILDEIHSIGQQEGGAVWEQIILFAPCPIIGLSATIGSPESFNHWLESVQRAHNFNHRFINFPHRYSHLRKFYYSLDGNDSDAFAGLATYKATDRTRFLHPVSLLSFGRRSALPEDLSLEARDTLSLYETLKMHEKELQLDLGTLDPATFFSGTVILKQKDVLKYEAKLKDILAKTVDRADLQNTSDPFNQVVRDLQDPVIKKMPPGAMNAIPLQKSFIQHLIHLVSDLHVRGELPAILFNFDRKECEIMAQILLVELEHAEETWRSQSPEWQRKLQEWEAWQLRAKDRERVAKRTAKQKKDGDAEPEHKDDSDGWQKSFDPDDPDEHFSFAGQHTSYSKSELETDLSELRRWTTTPSWALDALKRGIAVHHSGMNKKYRSLIESLYRQGFVRVMIATRTLALGINAPTKTSVFCGDSPFLTALMYRQCAGRAGRRGFDLLGNVVFYGIPLERVQRMVLSKLPSLGGNFPITSTLILRLLNLLKGSDNAPFAVGAIKSLMSLPQVSFGSDIAQQQLLHHMRFSIEYLRRSSLINREGNPLDLFAVAAHLYYTEPSNFALVALLRSGVLHKTCKRPSMVDAQHDFIHVMAHLFGRRYISKGYANENNLKELRKRYPSSITLEPLPPYIRDVLKKHDKEILRIFTGYAFAYASKHLNDESADSVLPISGGDHLNPLEPDCDSPLSTYLKETSLPVVARSIFVANSGHNDRFSSVQELARTARDGLHLNEHAIPSMSHFLRVDDKSDDDAAQIHGLNAYLLDFFTHGQVKSLVEANGIRRGDVWYLLQDFMLTLLTLKMALEQLLNKGSSSTVPDGLDVLDEVDLSGDEKEEEDESEQSSISVGDDEQSEPDQVDWEEEFPSSYKGRNKETSGKSRTEPKKPSSSDWRVYQVVCAATKEFEEKFKAMWA